MAQNQVIKILVVGGPEVGKTALLSCFNGEDFDPLYTPTVHSDFKVKDVTVGSSQYDANIWDIGGIGFMSRSFLRGTQAVVLVVDLTSKASLDGLTAIYERIRSLAGFSDDTFPCILLGNKCDIAQDRRRELSTQEIREWCSTVRTPPFPFLEVSAKTGANVNRAFEEMVRIAVTNPAKVDLSVDMSGFDPDASFTTEYLNSSRVHAMTPSNLSKSFGRSETDDDDSPIHNENEPYTAKVIIAGSPSVGKTCILSKFIDDHEDFTIRYEPTIGANLRTAEMPMRDKVIKLEIWDSSGDKKVQKSLRRFYRNADCLILVFDITSKDSFADLDQYLENFIEFSEHEELDEFPVLLVCNKSDLSDKRAVSMDEIIEWCQIKRPKTPITFHECSAIRNMGVSDIFLLITEKFYEYITLVDEEEPTEDGEGYEDEEQGDATEDEEIPGVPASKSKSSDPGADPAAAPAPYLVHNGQRVAVPAPPRAPSSAAPMSHSTAANGIDPVRRTPGPTQGGPGPKEQTCFANLKFCF